MNSLQPKLLALAAIALLAYIIAFERPEPRAVPSRSAGELLLSGLAPTAVTGLAYTAGDRTMQAERGPNGWRLTAPVAYPANELQLQNLLTACAALRSKVTIPLAESGPLTDFGLDPPRAWLKIIQPDRTMELAIGARTPMNNQLYVRPAGADAIAVVEADFGGTLPADSGAWRDRRLLNLARVEFDRFLVRSPNRLLAIQREQTLWRIIQPPPPKRGDTPRIEQLLQLWQRWPVHEFVTDDPAASLQPYGLDRPALELSFASGTNETLAVQFGASPTNRPELVYARLSTRSNVVLAASHLLADLRANYWEFCDQRLLDALPAGSVNRIEVRARDSFAITQQSNLLWRAEDGHRTPIDPVLMLQFLDNLASLRAEELAKEVVTDFSAYGLDQPTRTYRLLRTATNAAGQTTNHLVAQLDFGTNRVDRTYARRQDENAVYVVALPPVQRLPEALYQLQSRFIWNFTTNEVRSVTIFKNGAVRELRRRSGGGWEETRDGRVTPLDLINSAGVEESVLRLGLLQADAWVDRGADRLRLYGIVPAALKIALELAGPRPRTVMVAFGRVIPGRNPYAAHADPRDGEPVIFEFPRGLYSDYVEPYLGIAGP